MHRKNLFCIFACPHEIIKRLGYIQAKRVAGKHVFAMRTDCNDNFIFVRALQRASSMFR